MSSTLPDKTEVANQLLRNGSLFVHMDPRVEGVQVPSWLRHQAQLVLQVGLDMPIPIPDLEVTKDGVWGTLSFSHTPFTCFMPWEAVYALVGEEGRGMVWPDSMPTEVVEEVAREEAREAVKRKEPAEARVYQPSIPPLPAGAKGGTRKLRSGKVLPPWLRVIK